MIKVIIFDFGGVIGIYDNRRLTKIMQKRYLVDKKIFEKLELENRKKHDLGIISTKQFVKNLSKGLKRKFVVKEYYSLYEKSKTRTLNKKLMQFIKMLRHKYPIFLLTNNSAPEHKIIVRTGISKLFDKMLFSYVAHMKKPDKKFFKLLLKNTPYKYSDCLLIDDRADTCKIVRKWGMKSIIYKNNTQLKKDLRKLNII